MGKSCLREWDWIQPRVSQKRRWVLLPDTLTSVIGEGLKELILQKVKKQKTESLLRTLKCYPERLIPYACGYVLDLEIILSGGFGLRDAEGRPSHQPESHFFISWPKVDENSQMGRMEEAVARIFDLIDRDLDLVLREDERTWALFWQRIDQSDFYYRWTRENRSLFLEANQILGPPEEVGSNSQSNYMGGIWEDSESEDTVFKN